MYKKITSMLLTLALLLGIMSSALPVFAEGAVEIIIEADKQEAAPGDTINYEISMGSVTDIAAIEFKISIPEGLTFVSGALVDGLQTKLGAAACDFNADKYKIAIVGGMKYTSDTNTQLMTFSCIVDEDFEGEVTVGIVADTWYAEDAEYNYFGVAINDADAVVTVTKACQHDWAPATCTAPKTCTKCQATEGEKLEHSFTNYVSNNDATCTVDGTKTAKCDNCEEKNTVADAGTAGHTWAPATCTAPKTCTKCQATEGEKLEHSFTNYVSNNDATCTEDGTKTAVCDNCEATETVTDEGTALDHDFSEDWTVDSEATCDTDGSKSHHCSRCEEKSDVTPIPATGEHNYVTEVESVASTCKTAGYIIKKCGCGATERKDLELDADNHETVVVVDAVVATCIKTGLTEGRHCTACNTVIAKQETVEINTANHENLIEIEAKDPTCTDKGHTAGIHCQACNTNIETSTEIPASGHTWADATCTAPKTCEVCGETEGEVVGHSFTNYVSNNDATCTEDGTKTAKCDNCDSKSTVTDENSAGHDWVDATCTEPMTCTVCNATLGEALDHDWEDVAGTKTCKVCKVTIEWGSLQLIITADKNVAEPTDTITYTVALTPVQNIAAIEFKLVIPEGLTFVSGALADGLQETLGAAACGFNADTYKVAIAGMDYTSTELTTILTFTCTVDNKFTGELMIDVDEENWYFENAGFDLLDVVLNNEDSKVTVSCSHKAYDKVADAEYLKDEATCTTAAVYYESCKFCGTAGETEFEYGEALGHAPETVPAVAPDCENTGLTAGEKCSRCDVTLVAQESVAALGHSFTNYVSDNNATCTEDGTKTAVCDNENCDSTSTVADEGSAHHTWADVTCTTPKTCTACKITEGEALGHTPVTDAAKAPECEKTGLTEGSHCSRCNEVLVAQEVIPALEHNWLEATDVLPEICELCGSTRNVTVQLIITADKETAKIGDTITYTVSLGSVYKLDAIEFKLDIPEGLTFVNGALIPGLQQTLNAAACNFNVDKMKVAIAGGMAYTSAEITPILTFTCTVDKDFFGDVLMSVDTENWYFEDIYHIVDAQLVNEGSKVNVPCTHPSATAHEAVASSCTTPGHSEYSTCDQCGAVVDGSDAPIELDPENHVDVTVHTAVSGTCLRPGHGEYSTCNECGILVSGSTDEVIDPHGNRRLTDEKYIKTPATCTAAAVYYMSCEHCGEANETATFTSGRALGHDMVSVVGFAPTCTEPGLTDGRKCSRCDGASTQTVIPATGHVWKQATCTAPMTCTVCNITEGAELGHTWADATCTAPMTCTVCSATQGEALGHDWIDATYDAPKTCDRCGTVDGDVLPTYTVSGTVSSYGEATEEITVVLADGEGNVVHIVTTDNAEYSISNVKPGTYTMLVSKNGHATRTYTVTVGDADATQNAEIVLLGDINFDGKVNVIDNNIMYNHILEETLITDEYAMQCADMNGDGKIDIIDNNLLYDKVIGR